MRIKLTFLAVLLACISICACRKPDAMDSTPQFPTISGTGYSVTDTLVTNTPHTKAGVQALLIKAYSFLDGTYAGQPGNPWQTGTDNWVFGSVAGGDAHKGSVQTDQNEIGLIESYSDITSSNSYFSVKWQVNMTALRYACAVANEMTLVKDGSLSAAEITEITGEVSFLRGFYEFELAKLWRNVPVITPAHVYQDGYNSVTNPGAAWTAIETLFATARTDLPTTQAAIGRPNTYAARAFLAKAYMYDHNYAAARTVLTDLIKNGVTAAGIKYKLVNYADNFNPSKKPGAESVFVITALVNNGTNGYDGNSGDILNFPVVGPATCCGFFDPSFSFVNAFKTNATTGLPLLDSYNLSDLKNDMGIATSAAFTPTTATIDSRLDWSVGRRGIPYLDWGIMTGQFWARQQASSGPYINIKTVYYKAAKASTSESFDGWAPNQATSNSYNAIRFADILLMAAEAEIEVGSLQTAENYVNMVRTRAADKAGWVYTYKDAANPTGGYTTTPAANYKVGLYGTAGGNAASGFATGGQAYARQAVYFERMLELGMEGHRFFDLQRWDARFGGPAGSGFMAKTLNNYMAHEVSVPFFQDYVQTGKTFTAGKNEIYPIPQDMITKAKGKLKQNAGY